MKKIKLEIIGLSYSQTQSGAYALVLGEDKGKRRLPIIIGAFEAQAIAIQLENMTPTRPLTHDLLKVLHIVLKSKLKKSSFLIYSKASSMQSWSVTTVKRKWRLMHDQVMQLQLQFVSVVRSIPMNLFFLLPELKPMTILHLKESRNK